MPKQTLHIVLRILSFLGILSLKKVKNEVKTSSLIAYVNLIKVLFVFCFAVSLLTAQNIRIKNNLLDLKSSSPFSKVIVLINLKLFQTSSVIVCILQFVRRHEIADFANRLCFFEVDEKFSIEFTKSVRNYLSYTLALFLGITLIQFVFKFQGTFFSLLIFVVYLQPHLLMMSFITFMRVGERFFIMCLKDFKTRIKSYVESKKSDNSEGFELLKKYRIICDLNKTFNNLFGPQMSVLACCTLLMAIFQVI